MRTCGTFGLLLFPYSVERGVVEQSRELCGIGHDRGFGLGDLRFNFHAVSIAGRVRHPLSYPKDFCDLFFNDNLAKLANYHWQIRKGKASVLITAGINMIYFAVVAKGRDESAFIKRARRNEERAIFCKCEFYHVSIVSNRVRHPLSHLIYFFNVFFVYFKPLARVSAENLDGVTNYSTVYDEEPFTVNLHFVSVLNFHAVSIAGRVGHWLSYPKDFCDLFQKPRNCDEGGFMRHLAAMLTTERSVVVSDLMNRLGEVGVASEYAEVTHSRNFRFRGFNLDPVQFRFHAQRITETETNTRKIAKYFHPPIFEKFRHLKSRNRAGGVKNLSLPSYKTFLLIITAPLGCNGGIFLKTNTFCIP